MSITNGYATLAEVKAALRITDNVDDSLIEIAIESASRLVDGHCQRYFYSLANQTRVFTPLDSFYSLIDDLATVTTIKTSTNLDGVFDTTWTASDYQLEPLNGYSGGVLRPYTAVRAVGDYSFPVQGQEATLQIVGTFGWSAIPVAVKQAVLLASMRQYKRYDSPLGVAGYGDIGVMRVTRFDPDIEALLEPYVRIQGV